MRRWLQILRFLFNSQDLNDKSCILMFYKNLAMLNNMFLKQICLWWGYKRSKFKPGAFYCNVEPKFSICFVAKSNHKNV